MFGAAVVVGGHFGSRVLWPLEPTLWGVQADSFAKLFTVKAPLLDQILDVTIDDLRFIGWPQSFESSDTTYCNVVFALPASLHRRIAYLFFDICCKFNKAIGAEHRRVQFLSQQVAAVFAARERSVFWREESAVKYQKLIYDSGFNLMTVNQMNQCRICIRFH